MVKIDFDKYIALLSWRSIYWGIEKNILSPKNAILYAGKIIELNPEIDTPEIISLLISESTEKDVILSLIEDIISNTPELENNEESNMRLIRYIVLSELKEKIQAPDSLLSEIENIYADFDYPTDMESFIAYMPASDSYNTSEHSEEENIQHLIQNFNSFMTNEKQQLKISF